MNQHFVNATNLLTKREYGDYTDCLIKNKLQAAPQFIERLELQAELIGHNGCVNCLEFSENGRILASASDDYRVILWDPFRHRKAPLLDIQTPHRGNIFSVKFLPKSNNSLLVTGAADSNIFVFDVNRHESPIFKCSCHFHRVKRLAVSSDVPDTFWSCGEDGQVFQLDIREPHHCRSDESIVLVDLNNHSDNFIEAKCIAINPRKSYLMAVGANDAYARLYDRRMIALNKVRSVVENNRNIPLPSATSDYKDNLVKGCCQYYAPGHLQNTEHFNKTITYIAFSADGNELLANYGAEQIYLFDLNNAESPVLLNLPKFPEIQTQRPELSEEIARIKKLGNEYLEAENYLSAIKAYSKGIQIDPACSILYHNRATALMRRKWNGDVYDALKDCHKALKLDPYYYKAHFRLSRALLELNQLTLANEALKEFKTRFPAHDNDAVQELNHNINSALRNRTSNGDRNTTSELSDNEIFWRSNAKDFKERFIGHCNTKTDIKEANFFGPQGNYIVAGSDDGHFYIWERQTNSVLKAFRADEAIVNCVLPHPFTCLLATSGIDHEIRLWAPQPENNVAANTVKHVDPHITKNQKHMQNDLFEFDESTAMCRTS